VAVWFASTDATGAARTWTQGGTPTERLDRLDSTHHRCIAEEVIPTSGSGITRTATVTGSVQDIAAFMVLVRPAVARKAKPMFRKHTSYIWRL
jgi:hypothetical protein